MMAVDQGALLCDMAETYHIYSFDALPIDTIATLACGLREGSRIIMKMTGQTVRPDTLLSAMQADSLALLVWFNSEDGRRNRNRPPSVVAQLQKAAKRKDRADNLASFDTPEAFMAAREKLLKGGDTIGL